MRFNLGKAVHFYYVGVLVAFTALFGYGVKYYWDNGLLNNEYVSTLYDGTNRVKAVKERNDIEELKKFVDGDRLPEASRVFNRLEMEMKDLRSIKSFDDPALFDSKIKELKASLALLQSRPDLSSILNKMNNSVSAFENFVVEKNWPTLSRMTRNLRVKLSPGRLMVGGLYSFERTQILSSTVDNDLEALSNFTNASGLQPDIRQAVSNRIAVLKTDAKALVEYVENHKKFNALYAEFSGMYSTWFKQVEPQIALKKLEYEKGSQTVLYSLIGFVALMMSSIVIGFAVHKLTNKKSTERVEKLIIDTIKDGILPVDSRKIEKFSAEFHVEFDKYRDYAQKRMAFGSIFQEAMPFATILLDSNLNMVWGNSYFYEEWKLENFKDDEDSLTWDFLQRFTNLTDNTSIMNALRMSNVGKHHIQVKTTAMSEAVPYEMHVSPVDYSHQKRIMITFYPMNETQIALDKQKEAILGPIHQILDLQLEEKMTTELKAEIRHEAEKANILETYSKIFQYIEKVETITDELNVEIEDLERAAQAHRNVASELRASLINSYEAQKVSMENYHSFKNNLGGFIETREALDEQFKVAIQATREIFKDQTRIYQVAEKADKNMDEYLKSLKNITALKSSYKGLKGNVDEYKARVVQILDQLLIFQTHENDPQRLEQFMGQIKVEMKAFEKVLNGFTDVVTQLDVQIVKMDMLVESREKVDLDGIRFKMENLKSNLDSVQFSAHKISETADKKEEEVIGDLKALVTGLKTQMKRVDEMCATVGMKEEYLNLVTSKSDSPSLTV